MTLENRLMTPFVSAKYLSEENFRRYIPIIHYLYQQHEIYYAPPALPTDILEHLQNNDTLGLFEDYDLEKLESDLKQLEAWGNVISHPDSSRVTRIEDFNKRKLRYQCSQETIEIERMMEQLNSKISKVKGSLDAGLVQSLSALISQLEGYKEKQSLNQEERTQLNRLWIDIFDQFDNLRKESSDYLGIIHSKNVEEAMQNKNITAFRMKFTEYLTEFIIAIQKNIYFIEYSLKEIEAKAMDTIVEELTKVQKDKPLLDAGDPLTDEDYKDIFFKQWNGIKKWFIYDETDERYVDYLLQQTSETISKFTKYLQQLSERDQQVKNRKKDLEHLARLFKNEEDLEMCQICFGAMTNIERPLHFHSSKRREIEEEKSLYEHQPEVIPLKDAKEPPSRVRKKLAAVEPTKEDLEEMQRLKEEKEKEEQAILQLIQQKTISIKELKNVEPFVRKEILNWISNATEKNRKGKTDYGISYHVEKASDDWIRMECTDGALTMPDYILHFEVS